MINKRGLTPKEFDELPDGLFDMLLVFDSLIEPSGIKVDMMYHANSLYTTTLLSPNLTKESRRSLKPEDYDFLEILGDNANLTYKEKEDKRKAIAEKQQQNNFLIMKEQVLKDFAKEGKNG